MAWLTWFHGKKDGSWVVQAAVVLDALSSVPHVTTTQVDDVVVDCTSCVA